MLNWVSLILSLPFTLQPQNSIPDVIIWMLVGNRREAFVRIPSHEIMHSPDDDYTGKYSGRTNAFTLKVNRK